MQIEAADIEYLTRLLQTSGVASIEIETDTHILKLVADADAPPRVRTIASRPAEDEHVVATADVAGHFLARHPWRTTPFVAPGQRVEAGTIVGLIKLGLIYAPVVSPIEGILDAVLAETGTMVGYGTPIARIRPAA